MAHDNYRFYERTEIIDTTADTSSFRRIDDGYYRDDLRIFYLPDSTIQEVEGVDLNTFEVVYEVLGEVRSDARDAHSRYYNGERVSSH